MIKVVIYDDHQQPRDSLGALVSRAEGMECIGSFPDCSHVIEDMTRLRPDLVLMDIEMPKVDGISGVRKIKKEFPGIRIIMQTVFEDESKIFASLQAGAEGYILKNTSAEKIIESIREVHAGGASMTPSVALRVMKYFNHSKTPPDYSLTNKETEVLSLLSEGNSYKMV
ncbi:MAG TPA: response regulator transcription factor, partial [Saprospiraceae bacterium]|nr:response regulator transcription factor [Saprospiraceae bacterium]